MNIVALDLGTTTGWALRMGNGEIHSGSQSFSAGRFEGGGMRYLKFSRFLSDLLPMSILHDISATVQVVFEEVRRHRGVDAAHAYGGFMATLTAWCESNNVPYMGVPVGTIKRFATGKGNAGKDAVMSAVKAWKYNPVDDNEADALALVMWAAKEFNGTAVPDSKRPTPDKQPRRRVQVGPVCVVRKRVQG